MTPLEPPHLGPAVVPTFLPPRAHLAYRYQELQRQLAAAQEAAEQEEEEAELARAAAAVARLTAPEPPAMLVDRSSQTANSSDSEGSGVTSQAGQLGRAPSSGASTSSSGRAGEGEEVGLGGAAAKVKLLEEQVLKARDSVHHAGDSMEEDDNDDEGDRSRLLPSQQWR